MKKWFAVIGNPIAHSVSPLMHDTWLQENGIDASYIPIHVEDGKLAEAVDSLKLLGCSGWNVTIPYKEAIIPLLDEIDESVKGSGAVNTVVKTADNRFVGYNTDGLGFIKSLGPIKPDSQILMLGAGGAARGIANALKLSGFTHVWIANRTLSNAEKLVQDVNIGQVSSLADAEANLGQFDIIIQTTPQGMKNEVNSLPIELNKIKEHAIVADIVYNPLVTPFLEEANKYNVRTINGLGMLVHQGAIAFSYWNEMYPNSDGMMERLTKQLGGNYVNR
ncbi:shikimate dehydrogenase [Psychrobacillus sp.]|uniref:shikimate dehydrogenase n=1 Tax=Psychrobacillus sp. TaxID=1871623 RepID=UPI0028BE5A0E|nr:shikimate dehydrogenase [Psychrobacillus sp.]